MLTNDYASFVQIYRSDLKYFKAGPILQHNRKTTFLINKWIYNLLNSCRMKLIFIITIDILSINLEY